MADHTTNGNFSSPSLRLKTGLAEMLKGGVIMDVMNVEQARIAEEAGAISVMALERVPAMIRAEGGVARMANPKLIKQIIGAVSIPVMAKARIGHNYPRHSHALVILQAKRPQQPRQHLCFILCRNHNRQLSFHQHLLRHTHTAP